MPDASDKKRASDLKKLHKLQARREKLSREEYVELLHVILKDNVTTVAIGCISKNYKGTAASLTVVERTHFLLRSLGEFALEDGMTAQQEAVELGWADLMALNSGAEETFEA